MKRNIEAKFMQLTRNKEEAENFIKAPWNKVLNTNSSKGFQAAWKEMKCTKWCQNSVFMTYLRREWLPCRTKWAHCHTNRVRHFGNTSTNRVESSHSSLNWWMKLVVGENLLSEPSYKLFKLMYIRSLKTSRSQKSQMLRREDHHNSLPKGEGHGMSTRQQNVREVILLQVSYIMH
ncbi:hypothetical protein LINGRAHAP2_LOCUS23726 [Linum grandiflorum]